MKYFKLFRGLNLLIIAMMMYLTRFFIVEPAFRLDSSIIPINEIQFALMVFTFLLITAGGYAINDYFDTGMDEINRKEKRILNNYLPLNVGKNSFYILTIAGIILGIALALWLKSTKLIFIPLFIAALYWFYSTKYKRELIIGNMAVSFLAFLGVGVVWIYYVMAGLAIKSLPVAAFSTMNKLILIYAGFAFLATFAREIVKDLSDVEGDKAFDCKNIPIRWGEKTAKNIVFSIGIVLSLALLYFSYFMFINDQRMLAYFSVGLLFPFNIYWMIELKKANESKHYQSTATLQKLFIVMGILSMTVYYWQ